MIASSPRLQLPGWKAQIKHTPGRRSVSDCPVGLHIKLLSSDWAQITLIPVLRGNSTLAQSLASLLSWSRHLTEVELLQSVSTQE